MKIKLKDFKVRKVYWNNEKRNLSSVSHITGKAAVIEYLRQKMSVLFNELWWDYLYGLDFKNLTDESVEFWVRDIISEIEYIKDILNLRIEKQNSTYVINLELLLIEDEVVNGEIILNKR